MYAVAECMRLLRDPIQYDDVSDLMMSGVVRLSGWMRI